MDEQDTILVVDGSSSIGFFTTKTSYSLPEPLFLLASSCSPKIAFRTFPREIWLCSGTMPCLLLMAFFTSWVHQGLSLLPLFAIPCLIVPHTRAADEVTAALQICLSSYTSAPVVPETRYQKEIMHFSSVQTSFEKNILQRLQDLCFNLSFKASHFFLSG